jgi:hypothetical protein
MLTDGRLIGLIEIIQLIGVIGTGVWQHGYNVQGSGFRVQGYMPTAGYRSLPQATVPYRTAPVLTLRIFFGLIWFNLA